MTRAPLFLTFSVKPWNSNTKSPTLIAMQIDYRIDAVKPYINWDYFFFAWGVHNKPDKEKQQIREEAETRLARYRNKYQTHALFLLLDAYSDGDDVIVRPTPDSSPSGGNPEVRIPFLRQQQGSPCLCLADFIAPHAPHPSPSPTHQIGLFATSADEGMEHDFDHDPYEKMMMQLLADRLAEATAERLHKEVRQTYWGYARHEHLPMDELHTEQFEGIRPAVGYPSLPDASLNFLLDELLHLQQIGIHLTESGAMKPHASVSGLMLAHPQSRYFAVGKIDERQLTDYARRRNLPVDTMRRFLAANL